MKLRKNLYKVSKTINKIANTLGDVEAFTSGSPKKIYKRVSNKAKNKIIYKAANKISNKITRK